MFRMISWFLLLYYVIDIMMALSLHPFSDDSDEILNNKNQQEKQCRLHSFYLRESDTIGAYDIGGDLPKNH